MNEADYYVNSFLEAKSNFDDLFYDYIRATKHLIK
jgi:hypothetical protein